MSPLAHALSVFVPAYGVWQAHRHFALVDGLMRTAGAARGVDPVTAAIGLGIWWLTFTHYSTEPMFLLFDLIELLAGTAVVAYGQHALNAYWRQRAATAPDERVTDLDWFALAVAAGYGVLTAISLLSATTN